MSRIRFIIPLTFILGLGLIYLATSLFIPVSQEREIKIIEIPDGTGLRQVAHLLMDQNLISSEQPFVSIVKMMGAERQIHAGEYQFHTAMSPIAILNELRNGNVLRHEVTIPEGYNIEQIARLLNYRGLVSYEEFLRLSRHPSFLRSLGIEGESLEGYLYPETYYFSKGEGERKIIQTMISTFNQFYTLDMEEKARVLSMTRREIVTLASIIEKETSVGNERPLISAVFHNRLKRRIRLQSDPTVIYGLPDFDGNLTRKDLRVHSPYNTYWVKGLPPGPIANPGNESLIAVLNPAPVDYLYFVSKNNGTHYFSKTLSEHNGAVQRYQKNRRRHHQSGS